MDFTPLIAKKAERFRELESAITAADFYNNPQTARELMREHARLKELLDHWQSLAKARAELAESQELAKGADPEMAEMAQSEIPLLEKAIAEHERKIQIALLPPDANEDRDAIVEIRAGTGGSEAALFAADLYRMYGRFAEANGLKVEQLESSPSELGGLKEVIFKVSGESVFQKLKLRERRAPRPARARDGGARPHPHFHRDRRRPARSEEVDFALKPDELRIEVCRAGGPGGQGVNTTDSAVQVMHLPTGMIVRCQDGRSQQKNKEKALNILRSRLLEAKQREEAEKYAAQRKSQVGTGGREEKIRTYNFPQNRLTDHRIGLTLLQPRSRDGRRSRRNARIAPATRPAKPPRRSRRGVSVA